MGRELQKKKSRSSIPKTRRIPRGRTKHGKKKVNFMGNAVVAENWDRSLTLLQNYKQLGLTSRLNAPTGGVEQQQQQQQTLPRPPAGSEGHQQRSADALAILAPPTRSKQQHSQLHPTEVRVERDPHTGAIIRVLRGDNDDNTDPHHPPRDQHYRHRPLDDPLNSDSDPDSDPNPNPNLSPHPSPALPSSTPTNPSSAPTRSIISALEAQARAEAARLASQKRPRQQSEREGEWLGRLVERYGDDVEAMSRDRKLNPMQQTVGDLRRRVRRWEEGRRGGGEVR